MTIYFKDNTDVVEYVEDMLKALDKDLQWTMTIKPDKYEDCCVSIAIDMSSADSEKTLQKYLDQHLNT